MEIKPQYEHSKFGNFMFNLCTRATKVLVKHTWLYYLLAFTWGIILTTIGLLISAVFGIAKIFDKSIEFKKYYLSYGIDCGPKYWGGMSMGIMFCRDHGSSIESINPHEFGHTFQYCILGPFAPFLVNIPSGIRYWAMTFWPKKNWKPYDAMWFEDAATQCGDYAIWYLTQNN